MFTCPRPKCNRRSRAKRNSGGVVVYYKSIYKNVIENVSINPKDILWFRIKTESSLQDIYVCLCYIPPEDSKVYKNTTSPLFEYDFFQQLNSDIRKYSEKGKVYIAGDFNSRTGEQLDFVPEMHLERYLDVPTNNSSAISLPQRKNNDKVVNEYGRKLLALCKETDISIVNGRLEEGNCTFYSVNRDRISSSTIDYLITNGYNFRNVRNMRVLNVQNLSDHRAISFSLYLKYENVYVKKTCKKVVWNTDLTNSFLYDLNGKKHKFDGILDDLVTGETDINHRINTLTGVIQEISFDHFGKIL